MNEEATLAEEAVDAAAETTGQSLEELSTPALTATLVVKRNGAETEEVFPVNSPCVIGRFDPAVGPIDIDLASLPEGVYVSRKHAKLVQEDGAWKVVDLGSSNGTFVLGDDFEKVDEKEISDGTEIALGNARFVFHLS
jgi:pSer/pThr/pTyr-binding forkhead associated (FHA) protein